MLSMIIGCLFLVSCSSGPKKVEITPVGNEMKYAVTEFTVKAGQEVTLVMNNTATMELMKHNIVILKSLDNINEIGMKAVTAENYIPDHEDILFYTEMANAGEVKEITFTAPEKTGVYPYVCTFPGHYAMMRGKMIVQ